LEKLYTKAKQKRRRRERDNTQANAADLVNWRPKIHVVFTGRRQMWLWRRQRYHRKKRAKKGDSTLVSRWGMMRASIAEEEQVYSPLRKEVHQGRDQGGTMW